MWIHEKIESWGNIKMKRKKIWISVIASMLIGTVSVAASSGIELHEFFNEITRNTAIGRYRKKNAQKRTDSHMEDIAGEVEKIGNIIASDIETYLRKKEIIDIFDAFLGTLSERDRDIFVRRYWYMDSIKKIADRHNCGESRIKSILARSRKKLYYLLTEAGYAE